MDFKVGDSWVVLSPIEQSIKRKIEAVGTPLKNWDIKINFGIKTGYNEAFIISGEKKDELIKEDPKSADLIRPILRGRDIKRYGYDFADLWLINTHNGIKAQNIPPVDVNNYPAIKRHLDSYWDKLVKRQDKGDTPYNLRNCVYMGDFSQSKIIYPKTTQGAYFFVDNGYFFANDTCFILLTKSPNYLVTSLSSKLFYFGFKKIFSSVELGLSGYQYNKIGLEKLPIISVENLDSKTIEYINLLYQKRSNAKELDKIKSLENKIDSLIHNLYGISEEEIEYINLWIETKK